MAVAPHRAAGWYTDPVKPGFKRYWDGKAWTDRTVPPMAEQTAPTAETLAALPAPHSSAGVTQGVIVGGTVIAELGGIL